jgi:hypothetical protein
MKRLLVVLALAMGVLPQAAMADDNPVSGVDLPISLGEMNSSQDGSASTVLTVRNTTGKPIAQAHFVCWFITED